MCDFMLPIPPLASQLSKPTQQKHPSACRLFTQSSFFPFNSRLRRKPESSWYKCMPCIRQSIQVNYRNAFNEALCYVSPCRSCIGWVNSVAKVVKLSCRILSHVFFILIVSREYCRHMNISTLYHLTLSLMCFSALVTKEVVGKQLFGASYHVHVFLVNNFIFLFFNSYKCGPCVLVFLSATN